MAEVYEMLMKLGLSGGALNDLVIVSDRLSRIHRQVEEISRGFSRWHVLLGGIGTALVGAGILDLTEKLIKHTAKYSDELVRLKNLGPEMAEAVSSGIIDKRAFDISKRVPLSVTDLAKIPGLAYSIFGKEEAINQLWEPIANYAYVLQQQEGHKGTDPTKDLGKALRSGELMGRFTDPNTGEIDLPKVEKFLDVLTKASAVTHGMVNINSVLGLAQQGGVYTRGLSPEGLVHELIIAQAMGGHRAGTAYMSLWQQMAGGTMFNRTAVGMEEMGLLKKGEWSSKGGRVILGEGVAERLTGLIDKDPMVLAGLYKSHFKAMSEDRVARGEAPISPEDQLRMVIRSMNRQTTQRMMGEIIANEGQILRESERFGGAAGVAQSKKNILDESVTANIDRMHTAWENLLIAIGGPQGENAIAFLKAMTGVMQSMTDSVRGMDPSTLKAVGVGIVAVGGALVLLGGAAVVAALATIGAVPLAVAAIATAITTFVAINWDTFKEAAIAMKDMGVAAAALAVVGWNSIGEGLNTIKTAIVSFIDWTVETSKSLSKRFGDWLTRPLIQNQSYQGPTGTGGQLIPANFNPGERKQILQPITLTLNLDGHQMGMAMSEILEDMSLHPTGPPDANGWNHFRAMGNQDTT